MIKVERIFHYTTRDRLLLIEEAGAINPSTAGMEPGERPAVWLTKRDTWEATATKLITEGGRLRPATMDEMLAAGLARIEVRPSITFHNWSKFVKKSGVSSEMAKALRDQARRQGSNVNDWLVSFSPISSDRWIAVERWDESSWLPVKNN
jgi:hypothetical protein